MDKREVKLVLYADDHKCIYLDVVLSQTRARMQHHFWGNKLGEAGAETRKKWADQ